MWEAGSVRRCGLVPLLLPPLLLGLGAAATDSNGTAVEDMTQWAGGACSAGRRRRSDGLGNCECVVVAGSRCAEYNDNCCEPYHTACCDESASGGCSFIDPACMTTTTTTTTFTLSSVFSLCPWLDALPYDDVFECVNGTMCGGEACCAEGGGRAKCPNNMPSMCNNRTCGGGNSYCCHHGACEGPYGGRRVCVDAVKVSAGEAHSLFLAGDGTAWATGDNRYGQLGDGTRLLRWTPVKVLESVQAIHSMYHSVFVKRDGSVWTSGWNSRGQLGDGSRTDRPTPLQIMTGVRAASVGMYHSLFLRVDGTAWAVGDNTYGQLADGTQTSRLSAIQVMENVEAVSAGSYHSMFVKMDGTVWTAGWNVYGQLGEGTNISQFFPVQVLTGAVAVEGGGSHSVFLRNDGTAWTAGYNQAGQLGDGSTTNSFVPVQVLTQVEKISAGSRHTLFLRTDGSIWGCGYNLYGQLGFLGGTASELTPVQVLTDALGMSAGDQHSIFLRRSGWAAAAGFNSQAQLGDGTTDDQTSPVDVIDLWPAVTTTTTTTMITSSTRTSTYSTSGTCAPNEFPISPSEGFSAAGFAPLDVLWSSSLLMPVLAHEKWAVGEQWTLSFRATSNDSHAATFGVAGGSWFLIFQVPPGAQDEFVRVTDRVMYSGGDSRVVLLSYDGFPAKVQNVTFQNVYLAPGLCEAEPLTFAFELGGWGACSAPCEEQGEQSRTVHCVGSDGRIFYDGFACYNQARPSSVQNCTGEPCPIVLPPSLGSRTVLDTELLALLGAVVGFLLCCVGACLWVYCRGQPGTGGDTKIHAEPEPEEEKKPVGRMVGIDTGGRRKPKVPKAQEAWKAEEKEEPPETSPLREEPKDLQEALEELAASAPGPQARGRRGKDDFYGAGYSTLGKVPAKKTKQQPDLKDLMPPTAATAKAAAAQPDEAELLRTAAEVTTVPPPPPAEGSLLDPQ